MFDGMVLAAVYPKKKKLFEIIIILELYCVLLYGVRVPTVIIRIIISVNGVYFEG